MISSRNPNVYLRLETWVMFVTKVILPYSSISLLHPFHGKYDFFPCMWA